MCRAACPAEAGRFGKPVPDKAGQPGGIRGGAQGIRAVLRRQAHFGRTVPAVSGGTGYGSGTSAHLEDSTDGFPGERAGFPAPSHGNRFRLGQHNGRRLSGYRLHGKDGADGRGSGSMGKCSELCPVR